MVTFTHDTGGTSEHQRDDAALGGRLLVGQVFPW